MVIDEFMSDWREKYYGQFNPELTIKIRQNIEDLKSVLSESDSLLDVGCNRGSVYAVLNHKNYEGIDLDPEPVSRAKDKYPEGYFRVADLFDLTGQWDVVLASRVLMHVAPFRLAMNKLLGAARKKCVLFVPIGDDSCVLETPIGKRESYFRTFSEASMKSMGECQIIRREPYSTVIYG